MVQHLNSNNSKVENKSILFVSLIGTIFACAAVIGIVAMEFSPPLTGRLNPALVPLLLVGVLMVGLIVIIFSNAKDMTSRGEFGCDRAQAVDRSSLVAAVLSIVIFALCTRPLGIVLTSWIAITVATYGMRGVSWYRAALTGAYLSAGFSTLFVGVLRQPLPIWPQSLLQ